MVNEVKELLAFGLSAGELVAGLADGVGFDDVGKAIKAARLAKPAFKDAKLALEQYIAASPEEVVELEQFVVDNFDIADDKIEAVIETALKVVIQLHDLAGLIPMKKVVPVVA